MLRLGEDGYEMDDDEIDGTIARLLADPAPSPDVQDDGADRRAGPGAAGELEDGEATASGHNSGTGDAAFPVAGGPTVGLAPKDVESQEKGASRSAWTSSSAHGSGDLM